MQVAAYAARTAPRYTSYPTARAFTGSVNAPVFQSWLKALPAHADFSVYLHVPYCRALCHYCACNTFAVARESVLADYSRLLCDEIELVARATSARRVAEIHWGGGTPNILTPSAFEEVVLRLDRCFDLDGLREHSVEIDPRSLTAAQVEMYARLGVTRASLGVQDLTGHVQNAIGRVQSYQVVAQAVARLRQYGIQAINFDLMYGLPRQTIDDVRHTIREVVQLNPNRVAVFGYAHVPWLKARQRLIASDTLPDPEARLGQAEAAREELLYSGYRAIGFDHYALPLDSLSVAARHGELRRNFQGFVGACSSALLGFGASAISTLPQGYAQNAAHPTAWAEAVKNSQFATTRGHALTREDIQRRGIIESLLCQFAVDLAAFGGLDSFVSEQRALRRLGRDGLVHIDGSRLVIPLEMRQYARLVAAVFDTYLSDEPAAHSGVS